MSMLSSCVFKSVRVALSAAHTRTPSAWLFAPSAISRRYLSVSRALYEVPKVVYLGNIPFNTALAEVKDLAEGFGTLTRITMPVDHRNRPAGIANVEFENANDAKRFFEALKRDGAVIGKRRAVVKLVDAHQQSKLGNPPTNALHITNFPRPPTAGEVESFFEPWKTSFIKVAIAHGYSRPFAHALFTTTEAATEALNEHRNAPFQMDGRTLSVDFAADVKTQPKPSKTVYVRGELTEDEIRGLLRPHQAKITRVALRARAPDSTARHGHIECVDIATAGAVLEACQGHLLAHYATPSSNRNSTRRSQFGIRSNEPRDASRRSSYGGDWGGGQRGEAWTKREDN
ncbi:hypothetical protein V5O48_002794 [Marasmius crinis-equi]|uniref:RRM domain-containing protein n=1 Tax=Marasmius crinis-equi TaxID=585013 RepID=A0ABR3FVI7_9AGAR